MWSDIDKHEIDGYPVTRNNSMKHVYFKKPVWHVQSGLQIREKIQLGCITICFSFYTSELSVFNLFNKI